MQQSAQRPPQADPQAFRFFCPCSAYEDLSKADQGQQMRIAGIASTESRDLQGEEILQDGLDWTDCLGVRGFFNNDHKKSFLDILGAPERVQLYKAGDKLPDGSTRDHACTWIEGHLFDTDDGRKTFQLARVLRDSGRQLGMSVEGKVEQRTGPAGMTIAKARIQHVAITHQPVNQECTVDALLRSLSGLNKALAVNGGASDAAGAAATEMGRNLTREQLDPHVEVVGEVDGDAQPPPRDPKTLKKRTKKARKAQKSLSRAALLKSIFKHLPDASASYALALCQALRRD